MSNPRLSYKDVENAIDALIADGSKVTNDTILAKLGRGSKSTIHRYFRTWQNSQPRPQVQERKLPDAMFKAIAKEFDEVEARAIASLKAELLEVQHNADELASAGEQLEEKIAALEAQLLEANEEKTKLSALLEHKEDSLKKLESEKLSMQATIEKLMKDLAKADIRLEDYTELKSEHKKTLVKLEAVLIEAAELRGKKVTSIQSIKPN